jgi:chemotaxis protein CheX
MKSHHRRARSHSSRGVSQNADSFVQEASRVSRNDYALPEVLDLTAAEPLATALLKMSHAEILIDASHVLRLDAPCLQVLVAAATLWRSNGNAFKLGEMSPRFVEDVSRLGLALDALVNGVSSQ